MISMRPITAEEFEKELNKMSDADFDATFKQALAKTESNCLTKQHKYTVDEWKKSDWRICSSIATYKNASKKCYNIIIPIRTFFKERSTAKCKL